MIIYLKNKHSLTIDDFHFRCCIGKNGITKKKKEGDNHIVAFRQQSKKNKGKHGASTAKNICKITCKNKK